MPFDGVGFIGNESVRKMDEVIDLLGTPDKWCKGALRSHDGRYCIRGAVRAVDAADALEPTILEAIGQVAGKRFRRIESFQWDVASDLDVDLPIFDGRAHVDQLYSAGVNLLLRLVDVNAGKRLAGVLYCHCGALLKATYSV